MRVYSFILSIILPAVVLGVSAEEKGESNPRQVIEWLVAGDSRQSDSLVNKYHAVIGALVGQMKEQQQRWQNDRKLLSHLFYTIHRKYLLNYKPYDSFVNLMEKGEYGCLTATAFYAIVLEGLGYEFEMVETNYHIYLMVTVGNDKYLMESTDPFNGFVAGRNDIEERLAEYKKSNTRSASDFRYDLHGTVDMSGIVGLQYYNEATVSFNSGDIKTSLSRLNEAAKFYHSERITGFLQLVEASVDNVSALHRVLKSHAELSTLLEKE